MTRMVLNNDNGFTLLEVIVVLAILAFMTAMVAPVVGYLDSGQRTRITQTRLDALRTAIVGPRDSFDGQGMRVLRGYAGDVGQLPVLYRSTWDPGLKRWQWSLQDPGHPGADENDGYGQPRGLWERQPVSSVDLYVYGWRGPYISGPKPDYPGAGLRLATSDPGDPNYDYFRKIQVDGKLSDAWGDSFYFFKEGSGAGAALLAVSAGPDGNITLPDPDVPGSYDPNVPGAYYYYPGAAGNTDNILLRIAPEEWYSPNLGLETGKTRQILEQVRTALLGPPDAFDASGRRIVGGYIGDMGQWPKLWKWDDGAGGGAGSWILSADGSGQPRGLWTWDDQEGTKNPDPPTGFAWRGPYLARPWGAGRNESLCDAWGTPLQFTLDAGTQVLTVTSAGRDKLFKIATDITDSDDIAIAIGIGDWQAGGMSLSGAVVNNTGSVIPLAGIDFFDQPSHTTELQLSNITTGGPTPFVIPLDNTCEGLRRLKLLVNGVEKDSADVYIGPGGTQSPSADKLTLSIASE